MQLTWKGQSCFEISSSQGKDKRVTIVVDPFDEDTGLRLPKLEADILLITHQHRDHNNKKAVSGNPFLIDGPGEYEVKEVFIQGIQSSRSVSGGKDPNTIYTISVEGLRVCHLGGLGQKELTPEQAEQIGEVDVLLIPVGGINTISAKEAVKIMSQIEPSIIVPMHYQIPKLKIKLEGLDKFLKTMGIKSTTPLDKLTVKKKDIISEEAKIVVLNP